MDYLEQIQLERDLNSGSPDFKSGALTTRPRCLLLTHARMLLLITLLPLETHPLFPFTHPEFGRVIFRQRGYCICDLFSESHEVPKNNGLIFHMGEVSEL